MTQRVPQDDTHNRAVCSACNYIDYQNPKIITGVLPVIDDEILLCKRALEPRLGKWTIPSGFMELNETVEEGALREAYEEAGISPEIKQLYCVYNLPHIGQVYFLYLATLSHRNVTPGIETSEAYFAKLSDIPWEEIAFSSVTFALKKYINDYKNKSYSLHTGVYISQ